MIYLSAEGAAVCTEGEAPSSDRFRSESRAGLDCRGRARREPGSREGGEQGSRGGQSRGSRYSIAGPEIGRAELNSDDGDSEEAREHPQQDGRRDFAEHEPRDRRRVGADRDANAELAEALRNIECQDAVYPRGREEQRDERKCGAYREAQTLAAGGAGRALL